MSIKFCERPGCRAQVCRDARRFSERLCQPCFDEWLEEQDAKHVCRAPADPSLADAIVGHALCSCGEPVVLDEFERREVADRITSDLEDLKRGADL